MISTTLFIGALRCRSDSKIKLLRAAVCVCPASSLGPHKGSRTAMDSDLRVQINYRHRAELLFAPDRQNQRDRTCSPTDANIPTAYTDRI